MVLQEEIGTCVSLCVCMCVCVSFQSVEVAKLLQHLLLTGLSYLPCQKHFVYNSVDLVEVEHQVKLADITEELIQYFHKIVDSLEIAEVVVLEVQTEAEVQTSVSSVDNLEVTESHKVGVFGVPHSNQGVDLFDQLLLFVIIKVHVPLG